MNPKKFFQTEKYKNMDLQERIFRLLVQIGLAGLAVGIIASAIAGKGIGSVLPLIAVFVAFMCMIGLSIRYHKIQLGAALIGAVIIFVALPYDFLSSNGIYGGAPIWFLFGIFYVCLAVEGRMKYLLLAGSFVSASVCYFIAYKNSAGVVTDRSDMLAYINSFLALVIVAVLTCCMIIFQSRIYRSENAVAQKQKKEIEELSKAQNRFFSSMSHEIRTPINTIIGLNEMILREDVSDEVAADAKNIQGASKMLLTLINDILDVSKIESGKMDIVPVAYDVGATLSDIVNMIWVRAQEKGLEFHIDVDQTIPAQLYGDEVRIKQILINVLNNAVKYTSEGSVTLSIQCKRMNGGKALISYSVTDTGMGIKKESIPYLFSAFKRVDEQKNRYIEGTGLGLSIVKQLVELMGGDIAVNSVYTKGSTFLITLPQEIVSEANIGELNLEARHALNAREHYKQSFEAPRARVLVVDDNETNLMVAEKLLRDTKVTIDTATSGRECLEKTLQNRYDTIFMDHLMPVMDGIECLHELRIQTGGLNQETPVVALTANAGGENQAIYRRAGFDGYLLKPVSGKQLEAELVRHLPKELVSVTNAAELAGMEQSPVLAHKKKLPIMICTDSVCDLPKRMIEKYQIPIMPHRVLTDCGDFLDGIEIETDGIISYMKNEEKRVKSGSPTVEEYEEFFAEQLTKAQYVVHIGIASRVSPAFTNALEASRTFDNVVVVDSGHLSCGMGLVVLRALDGAMKGMNVDAIVSDLERAKAAVKTSFIVDSTDYLLRMGRMAPNIHVLCKALMLHPIIVLKNSKMTIGSIKMGTRIYTRRKYIDAALGNKHEINKKILFIAYAGMSREELREIEDYVRSRVAFEEIVYQKASPSISINCGPGTFGLMFMMKK